MNEKRNIVIIEDDEVLAKSLVGEFEDAGFGAAMAFDGDAGLKLVLEEKPDLILLDIVMPKMDGMTMLTELRKSGEFGAHVPVIFLTNLNADDKIIGGVVETKPAHYLVKSDYALADVVTKVRDYLGDTLPSTNWGGNLKQTQRDK